MRINLAVVLALLVDLCTPGNAIAHERFPTWKTLRKLAGNLEIPRLFRESRTLSGEVADP